MTPLATAVEAASEEAIPTLLDAGADIEARDDRGDTPLILACASSDDITFYAPISMLVKPGAPPSLVELLIQRGADVQASNAVGATALHYAAGTGKLPAIRLLLEKGAKLEATTSKGLTPLGTACLRGQVEVVRLLLEHGANPDFPDANGQTPRQIASHPFTMKNEVKGKDKLTPEQEKQIQQMAEAYSTPFRAGRQKIAELFRAIPKK